MRFATDQLHHHGLPSAAATPHAGGCPATAPGAARQAIPAAQILVFGSIMILSAAGSAAAAMAARSVLGPGDFTGILTVGCAAAVMLVLLVASYRLVIGLVPRLPGDVLPGTRPAFIRDLSVLYHLLVFNSITKSWILPVPLMTAFYRLLGARLGRNTYIAGMVFDPDWVEIGDDCLVGHNATLIPHVIENGRYALHPIRIGDNCTIGAGAILMPGVEVRDGAIIAAGALVTKGSVIGAGETWAGIPARRIRPGPASLRESA